MIRMRALIDRALAISTICCRPMDSWLTIVRGEQSSPI